MNGREFVRALAASPETDNPPRTAAELTERVEKLFAGVEEIKKVYEEYWTGEEANSPLYRVVPVTWCMKGKNEAELCAKAWDDMVQAAIEQSSGTLIWRKRPEATAHQDFDSNEEFVYLRFRVAVRPADWRERARTGAKNEYWVDRGGDENMPAPVLVA